MYKETDIVIIGAGLTGLTTTFHAIRKGYKVTVLERENRPGGQIQTFREEGFTYESGPNTGAVSHPEVAELFSLLRPGCILETANEEAKIRLIWKGNRFHPLPCNPLEGLTTPLFSLWDKFRILGEPFRSKGANPDEPVGELARRRLGKSYLDYAVDPFISGVYAGDPMKLTTRYALPKLYNLEQQYGGFIKGAIAKSKEPKTDRDKLATKKVFSAEGGLQYLIKALVERIGKDNIILEAKKISINPIENGWKTTATVNGDTISIHSGKVITTTGAYTLPELLPFISPENLYPISSLKYAPVIQTSVGVKNTDGLKHLAFGGLVPSRENKQVLGILFPAACFKNRAPLNGALFSFFMGGVKRAELLSYTDQQIEELILQTFHEMLKFPATKEPDMIRIFRHNRAIPQYDIDSGKRFETIDRLEKQYPGLILGGNIRNGIGMADRIRQATYLCI